MASTEPCPHKKHLHDFVCVSCDHRAAPYCAVCDKIYPCRLCGATQEEGPVRMKCKTRP